MADGSGTRLMMAGLIVAFIGLCIVLIKVLRGPEYWVPLMGGVGLFLLGFIRWMTSRHPLAGPRAGSPVARVPLLAGPGRPPGRLEADQHPGPGERALRVPRTAGAKVAPGQAVGQLEQGRAGGGRPPTPQNPRGGLHPHPRVGGA